MDTAMDVRVQITRAQENGDELIELLWRDLGQQVSRARIVQVTSEVADRYRDATVTAYIPLFVRRLARERLQAEMRQVPL